MGARGLAGRARRLTTRARLTRLLRVRGVPTGVAAPFWAATGVHLAAQLADSAGVSGAELVAAGSKTLLLPALALVLARGLGGAGRGAGGRRTPRWWPWAAAAVTSSWLGDLALIDPDLFLVGVGLFGVAQVAYAVTFLRAGDRGRTAGRPWLLAPYVVWWLALAGFFVATGGLTPFVVAVAVYGLALGSMAHLAHRISPAAATGAALFVLSDSLIGLRGAGLDLPAHGFWVMLTYLVAQWLLVRGMVGVAAEAEGAPDGQARVRSRTSATSGPATPGGR